MVQVLHRDGFTVMAVRQKVLRKADYKGGYSLERYHDEFKETDPQYYLIGEDQKVVKFKPKKRSVLKVFTASPDALKEYLDEHELDMADPSDMAQLVSFFKQAISSED